jgi:hypothetical protein
MTPYRVKDRKTTPPLDDLPAVAIRAAARLARTDAAWFGVIPGSDFHVGLQCLVVSGWAIRLHVGRACIHAEIVRPRGGR